MTRVTITGLGRRGEGVAGIDGRRVFVPLTLSGETVDIDVDADRGLLREVIAPSPDRIDSFCPHFGACGGCQLQHLGPNAYTTFKRDLLVSALVHAGIEAEIAPLVDARGEGRRRVTLHARREGAGFMGWHSHALHPLDHCPILVPTLAEAPAIAAELRKVLGDADVSLTSTLTGLDVNVRPERKARPEPAAPIAARLGLGRLSVNGETIIQAQAPLVRMGTALVEIPPASFLQATDAAEAALAERVVAGLTGAKNIADLFCGLGPFALRLAARATVYAADSDGAAIASLAKAHRNTRRLKQIVAEKRDLFREALTFRELDRFDGLVFDPPRAGAEAQAREIAHSKVPVVVAVSCEPQTFARDAAVLVAGGYRLETVTPFDQFAWSAHVEIVGVFRR